MLKKLRSQDVVRVNLLRTARLENYRLRTCTLVFEVWSGERWKSFDRF